MEVTGLDRLLKVATLSFLNGYELFCSIGWVGLDIFHNSSIILRLASMAFFHLSATCARCCRYHFRYRYLLQTLTGDVAGRHIAGRYMVTAVDKVGSVPVFVAYSCHQWSGSCQGGLRFAYALADNRLRVGSGCAKRCLSLGRACLPMSK